MIDVREIGVQENWLQEAQHWHQWRKYVAAAKDFESR